MLEILFSPMISFRPAEVRGFSYGRIANAHPAIAFCCLNIFCAECWNDLLDVVHEELRSNPREFEYNMFLIRYVKRTG